MRGERTTIHYRVLDSYRFVAALGVALLHFDANLKMGLSEVVPAVARFTLCVDFFFILSGFVIALHYADRIRSLRDYGRFLQKRLARIYPLHLATLAVFILIGIAIFALHLPLNHLDYYDPRGIPANLALVQAWGVMDHLSFNTPSWSISAEFFVYLLFPALAWLAGRLPTLASLLLVVAVIVAMRVARAAAGLPDWTEANCDFAQFRALPTFFLGILIARMLPRLAGRVAVPWVLVHGLALAILAGLNLGLPNEAVIALFVVLVMLAALAERTQPRTVLAAPLLVTLGNASYALYMTHWIALLGVMFVMRRWIGVGGWPSLVLGLSTIALTVLASVVIYRRFEDPWRRTLSGLRLGTASTRPGIAP